jgi:4-amino-4-deoxy-L-arabinose transferase-like glycosyltransferase
MPTVLAVVAMRARFILTPISSDESGYLAIARAWARGKTLYRDVWVDRPQVLLVVYRVLWHVGLATPVGVRLLAIAACLLGAFSCGSIAGTLAGTRAGAVAALCTGVLLSVPQYEGFTANAELLSGAVGALCLAIALGATWGVEHVDFRRVLAAGIVGGLSFGIKQSGFDAMTIAVIATGLSALSKRRRDLRFVPGVLIAGWLVPIAAMAIHGAATGWARWRYAIVGYRLQKHSVLAHPDWRRYHETLAIVRPILVPVLVVSGAVVVLRLRHLPRAGAAIAVSWLGIATFAFVLGGQFHRHYWVILMFPLGTLVGTVISTIDHAPLGSIVVVLALASPLRATYTAARLPRSSVGVRLEADGRFSKDEAFASWFRAHSRRGENIAALCAGAGLYGNVSTDPPFPYLWFAGIQEIPGAKAKLVELLESDHRPTFIAQYQSALNCDRSGRTATAIDRFYRVATWIEGQPVYVRADRA